MRLTLIRCVAAGSILAAVAALTSSRPSAQQAQPRPVFRSQLNVISVDVIVRDKSGAVVRGLTERTSRSAKTDAEEVSSFNFRR